MEEGLEGNGMSRSRSCKEGWDQQSLLSLIPPNIQFGAHPQPGDSIQFGTMYAAGMLNLKHVMRPFLSLLV